MNNMTPPKAETQASEAFEKWFSDNFKNGQWVNEIGSLEFKSDMESYKRSFEIPYDAGRLHEREHFITNILPHLLEQAQRGEVNADGKFVHYYSVHRLTERAMELTKSNTIGNF